MTRLRSPLALALLAAAAAGCSITHERAREGGPVSRPAGDEGMLIYSVGRISFEAPAGWTARGDAQRILLVSPANDARIDAQRVTRAFPDDAACLADAGRALRRGGAALTNVQRHPTSLAGRKAVYQEADQQQWHGWAWAVCDRGEQYRLFFTGRAPVQGDLLRAVKLLSSSAALAAR